jgi:hypothetical protein
MLSFYLAFIYANRLYYDQNRILCMAELLFKVQAKHRLAQKGLLKTNCYGVQKTLSSIRTEKTNKFSRLKFCRSKRNKKCTKKLRKQYELNFLRYIPNDCSQNKKTKKTKK